MKRGVAFVITSLLAIVSGCSSSDSPSTPTTVVTTTTTTTTTLPPVLWAASGSGDRVFDMPTYVRRVKIDAFYGGTCQNFVVRIAGRLVVNEILGNCSVGVGRDFTGTYATTGGQVEITNSTRVEWTFTEIR